MKSPTKRLPSTPTARATGASSLLPSARPLQLGQEMLRRRPFPMMLVIMAGCCVRNWFSPVPLCRIPGRGGGSTLEWALRPSGVDMSTHLLRMGGSDKGKGNSRKRQLWGGPQFPHNAESAATGWVNPKATVQGKETFAEITEEDL